MYASLVSALEDSVPNDILGSRNVAEHVLSMLLLLRIEMLKDCITTAEPDIAEIAESFLHRLNSAHARCTANRYPLLERVPFGAVEFPDPELAEMGLMQDPIVACCTFNDRYNLIVAQKRAHSAFPTDLRKFVRVWALSKFFISFLHLRYEQQTIEERTKDIHTSTLTVGIQSI